MELIVAAVVAVAAIALLKRAARRASTIAELEVEAGEIRVVHGGIAGPVLADLRDVVRHAGIRSARIRIVRARRHASVELEGDVSAGEGQRIRNVVGRVPLAMLARLPRE